MNKHSHRHEKGAYNSSKSTHMFN